MKRLSSIDYTEHILQSHLEAPTSALPYASSDYTYIYIDDATPKEYVREQAIKHIPQLLANLEAWKQSPSSHSPVPMPIYWLNLMGADHNHPGTRSVIELFGANPVMRNRECIPEHSLDVVDMDCPYVELPGATIRTLSLEPTENTAPLLPYTLINLYVSGLPQTSEITQ